MDTKPLGFLGAGISAIGAFIDSNELNNWVSIICSIGGFLLTVIVVLIIPLIKWWINAKKDNKITSEELDDLSNIISNAKDELDSNKKEKEKHD